MVKIEFTPLSLDRKIFPFKKGFKKIIPVEKQNIFRDIFQKHDLSDRRQNRRYATDAALLKATFLNIHPKTRSRLELFI